MIILKNLVYNFRKKKRLTQEDLARLVGVTRQTIISIEQGKYIASLPLALKFAKIFETSVEEIFQLEEGE